MYKISKKFKICLFFTLVILAVVLYLFASLFVFSIFTNKVYSYTFAWVIFYLIMVSTAFISLLYIYHKKKIFTNFIIRVILFISLVLLCYSFLLPHYSEYVQMFAFKVFQNQNGYLMDGWFLLLSLFAFFLSRLIKYGSYLQEQVDDTI